MTGNDVSRSGPEVTSFHRKHLEEAVEGRKLGFCVRLSCYSDWN